MLKHPEKDLKMGLQAEDANIIKYLYKNYFSAIKKMVLEFNNKTLDPEDIFQEGMVRMILNIRNGKFKEKGTVFSYLYGICRNICLKKLYSEGNYTPIIDDLMEDDETSDDELEELNSVLDIFSMLDMDCQEIINLRFGINQKLSGRQLENKKNLKFDEIARILNIRPENARQKFRRCLEKLKGLIKHNSESEN